MNGFWFELEHLPFIILVMLVAFTVHEFAHAWTAYKCGDDTAYREGRVTLNPMAHLDWFGFILLILAGFGWAKPVPIRPSRFRRPRLMNILVTAAGPFSNLLLAFLCKLVIAVLIAADVQLSKAMVETLNILFWYWILININLFLFNLIPLPPLDGYRIAEQFMPLRMRIRLMQYEQWTFFFFLLLLFIPPLRAVTIIPLFSLADPILSGMDAVLSLLFPGAEAHAPATV